MTEEEIRTELRLWLKTLHDTDRLSGKQCSLLFHFLSDLSDYFRKEIPREPTA